MLADVALEPLEGRGGGLSGLSGIAGGTCGIDTEDGSGWWIPLLPPVSSYNGPESSSVSDISYMFSSCTEVGGVCTEVGGACMEVGGAGTEPCLLSLEREGGRRGSVASAMDGSSYSSCVSNSMLSPPLGNVELLSLLSSSTNTNSWGGLLYFPD